jgi:hypothetical protein
MSATRTQPVTHDIGMRISWNNRPTVSVRTDEADANMGLPGKDVPWQVRRKNMQDVCLTCHAQGWVDGFYTQYDALIDMYQEKFAKPGLELYNLAKPLRPVQEEFANKLDWTWYELWHHEGRRARHGASMMAPDYTHWHGTYEVAKKFYAEFVPELRDLVMRNMVSSVDDQKKAEAAAALQAKLDEVLSSDDHKWSIGKISPEEKAKRKQAAEEFKKRYTQ